MQTKVLEIKSLRNAEYVFKVYVHLILYQCSVLDPGIQIRCQGHYCMYLLCIYTRVLKMGYAKNQIIMYKACQAFLMNAICSAICKSRCINHHSQSAQRVVQNNLFTVASNKIFPPKKSKGNEENKRKLPSNHLNIFQHIQLLELYPVVLPRCQNLSQLFLHKDLIHLITLSALYCLQQCIPIIYEEKKDKKEIDIFI